MNIQGCSVIADYYVLPVAACPLVLGVQWLATLGPIKTDYGRLSMTFNKDGVKHTFQGIHQGVEVLSQKDCQQLQDTVAQGMGFFIQLISTCSSTNISNNLSDNHPLDLDNLLSKFKQVFQQPTTLPP